MSVDTDERLAREWVDKANAAARRAEQARRENEQRRAAMADTALADAGGSIRRAQDILARMHRDAAAEHDPTGATLDLLGDLLDAERRTAAHALEREKARRLSSHDEVSALGRHYRTADDPNERRRAGLRLRTLAREAVARIGTGDADELLACWLRDPLTGRVPPTPDG